MLSETDNVDLSFFSETGLGIFGILLMIIIAINFKLRIYNETMTPPAFTRKLRHIQKEIVRKRRHYQNDDDVLTGLDFLSRQLDYENVCGDVCIKDLAKDLNRISQKQVIPPKPISIKVWLQTRSFANFFNRSD